MCTPFVAPRVCLSERRLTCWAYVPATKARLFRAQHRMRSELGKRSLVRAERKTSGAIVPHPPTIAPPQVAAKPPDGWQILSGVRPASHSPSHIQPPVPIWPSTKSSASNASSARRQGEVAASCLTRDGILSESSASARRLPSM